MSQIKKIAVIGTGVIGTGWIIRFLAHNKIVHAFDKDIKLKKDLITEIKRTWPYVKKLFNKKKVIRFRWTGTLHNYNLEVKTGKWPINPETNDFFKIHYNISKLIN